MNCCDDAGRCHNGHNCAGRSQAPIRFAPGVIMVARRRPFRSTNVQHTLRRWGINLAAAVTLVAAAMGGGFLSAFLLRAAGLMP